MPSPPAKPPSSSSSRPGRGPPGPPKERVVFAYKKELLVARLCSTPGAIKLTVAPVGFAPPPSCTFASVQLFSVEWEADVQRALEQARSFDDLIKRLKYFKYRLEESGPRFLGRPFGRL